MSVTHPLNPHIRASADDMRCKLRKKFRNAQLFAKIYVTNRLIVKDKPERELDSISKGRRLTGNGDEQMHRIGKLHTLYT